MKLSELYSYIFGYLAATCNVPKTKEAFGSSAWLVFFIKTNYKTLEFLLEAKEIEAQLQLNGKAPTTKDDPIEASSKILYIITNEHLPCA